MGITCGIDGDQAYSDKLTSIYESGLKRLAERYTSGQITLDDWHQQMKDAIDKMYAFQGMAGVNGDRSRVDMNELQQAIGDQYVFLDNFANDIEQAVADGKSLGFISNRAAMYARSSQAEYWRQAIEVTLPHVPKDGSTKCKMNCTCTVSVDCEKDSSGNTVAVLATWNLDPTKEEDHCPDCPVRAREWNPLRIPVNTRKAA